MRSRQVVIMRGLNVLPNAKVPDFEPIKDLSTLDTMKPYGVNAVRQGFMLCTMCLPSAPCLSTPVTPLPSDTRSTLCCSVCQAL